MKSLLAGTLTKYLLLVLSIASGVVLMPFTIAHLGRAEYGLWMLVATLTTYFQLLDIGYGNGLVRHLVEADAAGDAAAVNRIASTFFFVYAVLGSIALVTAAILGVTIVPRFPNLSAADIRTAQILLAILAIRVAIGFPMTVFGAVTNARQGFVLNNGVAISVVVLNAAITYVVLASGGGLLLLVASTTAVNLLAYGGYAATARHVFPALRIAPRLFSLHDWKDVTAFSLYLFVIDIAVQIGFNIDNIVIGAALSTSAIAVYAVALRLSEYQRRMCDQFSGMMFPVVVSMAARGDTASLRGALVEGTRLAALLGTGGGLLLIGFASPLVRGWMGPGFEASVPAVIALGVASVVVVAHAPLGKVLIAAGSHRLVAAVWIVESIVNLALSVVLVRPYGLAGVAIGTAIPVFIGHFGVLLPVACRRVGLPLGRAVASMFGPALAGAVPAAIACATLQGLLPPASLRFVVVEALPVGLVYIGAAFMVGLRPEERAGYVALVRSALPFRYAVVE